MAALLAGIGSAASSVASSIGSAVGAGAGDAAASAAPAIGDAAAGVGTDAGVGSALSAGAGIPSVSTDVPAAASASVDAAQPSFLHQFASMAGNYALNSVNNDAKKDLGGTSPDQLLTALNKTPTPIANISTNATPFSRLKGK